MKLPKLTALLVLISFFLITPLSVSAQEIKPVDIRVLALKYYLTNYESPLVEYSDKLVEESDKYGMDWKLIPAIAAVESNFGHKIPGGKDPDYTSHNAWGWGVYGQKVMRFDNWSKGIEVVTEGINRRFIKEGMTDPYKMNARYSSNPDWSWQVVYFIDELEAYHKAFEQKFGPQIVAYNKRIIDLAQSQQEAAKYVMPESKIKVNKSNDRLSLSVI